jgi:hypothetical protein
MALQSSPNMSEKSYRDSIQSLNSLESITSDFGDSLLSTLNLEFSKFDITLPMNVEAKGPITERDLEFSPAVANAEAIINHFEKLDSVSTLETPPPTPPRRTESLDKNGKNLLSFEEMLLSDETRFLTGSSNETLVGGKPLHEEMDEFERMLTSTKTKHISATPNRMVDVFRVNVVGNHFKRRSKCHIAPNISPW